MTLPNKLSLSRILIIPVFLVAALVGGAEPANPLPVAWARVIALILVVFATVTDWLDGHLARKQGVTTNLGKLLDPLADKILVASAFVVLVELGVYPSWPVILILCREFLVTGLRSLAAAEGRVMAADRWGKHKTAWQLATIITAFTFIAAREFLRAAGWWAPGEPLLETWKAAAIFSGVLNALMGISILLTVISGWLYLQRNWSLLRDSS